MTNGQNDGDVARDETDGSRTALQPEDRNPQSDPEGASLFEVHRRFTRYYDQDGAGALARDHLFRDLFDDLAVKFKDHLVGRVDVPEHLSLEMRYWEERADRLCFSRPTELYLSAKIERLESFQCPVCGGKSRIGGGKTLLEENNLMVSVTVEEKCRSCNSKGYLYRVANHPPKEGLDRESKEAG